MLLEFLQAYFPTTIYIYRTVTLIVNQGNGVVVLDMVSGSGEIWQL